MAFGLFRKKDPVCGMKQEEGKGFVDTKSGHWFCGNMCKEEFDKKIAKMEKEMSRHKGGCCGH